MSNSLKLIILLIPIIGMMSGLFVSFAVTVFFVALLYDLYGKITINFKKYSLEFYFFTWLLFSTFWSIKFSYSLFTCVKILTIYFLSIIIWQNIHKLNQVKAIESRLVAGVIIAIILFWLEFFSGGIISRIFRYVFQAEENHKFYLFFLDRGCAFISLLSWIIIAIFIKKQQYFFTVIYYIMISLMFFFSDSLTSFLAFICGGIVFLIAKYIKFFRNPITVCGILITIFMAMIYFANFIDVKKISNNVSFLPYSAKHRLFIWQYVADKSSLKLVNGYGIGASKHFPIKDDEYIYFDKVTYFHKNEVAELPEHYVKLLPLSLHPHSNILQILFETGLVGLLLYVMINCKYLMHMGRNYDSNNKMITEITAISYACFANYYFIAMTAFSMWQSWWVCSGVWIVIMFSWINSNLSYEKNNNNL